MTYLVNNDLGNNYNIVSTYKNVYNTETKSFDRVFVEQAKLYDNIEHQSNMVTENSITDAESSKTKRNDNEENLEVRNVYNPETNSFDRRYVTFSDLPKQASGDSRDSVNSSLEQSSLLTSDATESASKPNLVDFVAATSCDPLDAATILYGVIGQNRDVRNWENIMSASNVYDAALSATQEMYSSTLRFELMQNPIFDPSDPEKPAYLAEVGKYTINDDADRKGNFALEYAKNENDEDVVNVNLVSTSGLRLRNVGGTYEDIERNIKFFGGNLDELMDLANQHEVKWLKNALSDHVS